MSIGKVETRSVPVFHPRRYEPTANIQISEKNMTSEDDVLPQSQKARAILSAQNTPEESGVKATVWFEWDATPPAWIDIATSKVDAAQMSELLPTEARAIFETKQTLSKAGIDITLQLDRASFCIGVHPPVLPVEIRLPAKEEIRLAVVVALEYQLAMGAADIAISQARSHSPDAPQAEKKHA